MTKSELRKARKVAVANGEKPTGELAIKKSFIGSNRTHRRADARIRNRKDKN